MNKSEQIDQLAASLSSLQGELVDTYKGTQGHGYKYTTLSDTLTMVRPLLKKHNLSISQLMGGDNGNISIETILMSSSGQFISSIISMPIDSSNKRINIYQSLGSGVSYIRRYALVSILGLASTDDDAHSAVPIGDPHNTQSTGDEVRKDLLSQVTACLLDNASSQDTIDKALDYFGVESIEKLTAHQLKIIITKIHKG